MWFGQSMNSPAVNSQGGALIDDIYPEAPEGVDGAERIICPEEISDSAGPFC